MPICSYLVIPREGDVDPVHDRLADLPECEVVRAENRDVLILVTETDGLEEEEELRSSVEAMDGIQALLLTFGEIDPETPLADPVAVGRGRSTTEERGGSTTEERGGLATEERGLLAIEEGGGLGTQERGSAGEGGPRLSRSHVTPLPIVERP